jgi:hypothetical protein
MNRQHHLSDHLFDLIYQAVSTRHHWMVFPSAGYYLQKGELHCFLSREEARAFANEKGNTGEMKIIYASSVLSAYQQIERDDEQQKKPFHKQ